MNNSGNNSNNKAARGSISQILLSALLSGDKYGYEICKDIEQRTNGKLVLKQPSLYSSLRRMEEQELIKSYWGDSDIGGRRHYYSITEKGKQKYEKHKDDWDSFDALIDSLPSSFGTEGVSVQSTENSAEKEESNKTLVLNQESLFNTNSTQSKNQIKKIENEDDSSSFLQFDLFNESANIINKKTIKETPTFESYTNKFADIDKHKDTIQPTELQLSEYEKVTDDEIRNQVKNDFAKELLNKEVVEEEKPLPIPKDEPKEEKKYDDAHILSESEKGQQSIDLDDFMKANFGFSTTDYKKESKKKDNKEKISINFVSLLNEENKSDFKEENFEITHEIQIPNLDKFPEVLKDDQRIGEKLETSKITLQPISNITNEDIPTSDAQISTSPSEEVDTKKEETYDIDTDNKTDSLEYQNVLGKLYSSTNRNDPYEISKLKKFGRLQEDEEQNDILTSEHDEEVLPVEEIDHPAQNNSFIKVTKEDLVQELKNDGVKLKEYKKLSRHTKKGNYINYYKLKIVNAWILWLIMAIETVATFFIIKNNNLLGDGHDVFYYWTLGITFIYPIYYSLTYLFNKEKKIESNFKINISIFNKFLAMLIAIVFIFSINLFIGMTSLNQVAYLSFWLLPTILATNFVVSSIIYFILLKTKKFYV